GFVSDHLEVLWDLDNEAIETATDHGIDAVRVPTPGVDPTFVAGLADLVRERVEGRAVEERAALTDLGPWNDVCRPGCCANARRPFSPVLAGVAPGPPRGWGPVRACSPARRPGTSLTR